MGIRYYAYPVEASHIDDARAHPFQYLGADPLMDAWGPEADRPEMLYLDKCWSELQSLLLGRPAYALVRGEVTHTQQGWIPHLQVLTAGQVADVASDLNRLAASSLRRVALGRPHGFGPPPKIDGYLRQYLGDAREFVNRRVNDGQGLVYMIG